MISGSKVIKWTALPPQAGKGISIIPHACLILFDKSINLGNIGIGILSYAGGISISIAADKVPGSEGVARRICERFEERFSLYVTRAKALLDAEESGDSE